MVWECVPPEACPDHPEHKALPDLKVNPDLLVQPVPQGQPVLLVLKVQSGRPAPKVPEDSKVLRESTPSALPENKALRGYRDHKAPKETKVNPEMLGLLVVLDLLAITGLMAHAAKQDRKEAMARRDHKDPPDPKVPLV
jgi:hypothetical protein